MREARRAFLGNYGGMYQVRDSQGGWRPPMPRRCHLRQGPHILQHDPLLLLPLLGGERYSCSTLSKLPGQLVCTQPHTPSHTHLWTPSSSPHTHNPKCAYIHAHVHVHVHVHMYMYMYCTCVRTCMYMYGYSFNYSPVDYSSPQGGQCLHTYMYIYSVAMLEGGGRHFLVHPPHPQSPVHTSLLY